MVLKKGFAVQTETTRCLNYWHHGVLCDHCASRCPTESISVGEETTVCHSSETCVGCGLCLSICPTQTFRAEHWDEQAIIRDVSGNGWAKIHLFCGFHEKPYNSGSGNTGAVRVPGCLAGLSKGLWFELGTLTHVELHLEHCQECELNKTLYSLADQVTVAAEWLAAAGLAATFFEILSPQEGKVKKRHRAISSGLRVTSRRDLFLSLVESGRKMIAEEQAEKRVRSDVARPAEWVTRFEAIYPKEIPDWVTPAFWPSIQIQETCKGCGLCTSYCPTGALHLSEGDSGYAQLFVSGHCIDCRICELFCPAEAIIRARSHNRKPFEVVQLRESRTTIVCRRCEANTVESRSGLCYWCGLSEDTQGGLLNTCRKMLYSSNFKKDVT